MVKKSLKDMLDVGIGEITGAKEATQSIVNRTVINQNVNENVKQDENLNVKLNEDSKKLEVARPTRFYDTHRNESFLVKKVLMSEVNKLSKKGGKGFKTNFINDAIREHLERYGVSVKEQ